METVTHKGKVYQVNELYFFHNGDHNSSQLHELCEVSETGNFVDENGSHWAYAVNNITLGTIVYAPIELIDGAAYEFTNDGQYRLGYFRDSRSSFFSDKFGGDKICGIRECDLITPLVKA